MPTKPWLAQWQEKLAAVDPLLTETIITQAIMDEWKKITNFNSADKLTKLLATVLANGKLKSEFAVVLTKEDAEIIDLAKLFQKKKASQIITLIKRFAYDQETDSTKKERLLKEIKMNLNKTENYILTDEEITTGLYKLAISEYSSKTDSEIAQWEKGETNDENGDNGSPKPFWKNTSHLGFWFLWLGLATVVIGGASVVIWWDKIKTWWNGPAESTTETKDEKDEDE